MMGVKSGVVPSSRDMVRQLNLANSQVEPPQSQNNKPWSNLNGKNIELIKARENPKGHVQNVISQMSGATTTHNTMTGMTRGQTVAGRPVQRLQAGPAPNTSQLNQYGRGKRQIQT